MRVATVLQTSLRLVYPPGCLTCNALVETDQGLCGRCWRETPFVGGSICDACGVPLVGDFATCEDRCDDCLSMPRPWRSGRTAMVYGGNGRRIVLGLKHGDRMDFATPAAKWMARVAGDLVRPGMLIAPVPLHWRRRVKRRYNQSLLLGRGAARALELQFCPDLLLRRHQTPVLDGKGRAERFATLDSALTIHPRRAAMVKGRAILLVDDVMTSGATLSAGTEALLRAGAASVCVLTLARAVKDATFPGKDTGDPI